MEQGLVREKRKLKVRCPSCYKLYGVETAEISEAKPRFQCSSCQTQFWVSYPDALKEEGGVIGLPMEWINEEAPKTEDESQPDVDLNNLSLKPFSCPRCGENYAAGDSECARCGVVFKKFKEREEGKQQAPQASRDLKEQWDRVLMNFDNQNEHESFIQMAMAEMSLDYADFCYMQILNSNPNDEQAQGAMKKIENLISVSHYSKANRKQESEWRFDFPKLRIGTMVMFLSVIVICMGFLIPGARNLVGFGSAVLFAMMALRYYFRVL